MKSKIRILLLFFGPMSAHADAQEVRNISLQFDSLKTSPVTLTQRFAAEQAVGLERLRPLADVAIGGLFIGTLLTLIFVPMYAYMFDKKKVKPVKEVSE